MRTRAFIVIAVAALALAGCGDRNLVLQVDVLSYLEASQKTITVETVPATGELGTIPILPDMSINLIKGLDAAAQVRSATLALGGQVTVETGSGSGKFKLYLSDEDTDPLTTQPVMNVPLTFSAAAPATVDVETAGSPAMAELFTQEKLRLAVVLDSVAIATPGVTHLTVNITKLEAIVLAGRKAF